MFGITKTMFIGLLNGLVNGFSGLFNGSNHKKLHIVDQSEMYDSTYFY